MAIPKRALLLSSFALSFFSKKYAPGSPLTQGSYVKTVLALFVIQYFAQAFYRILVYPFFLSPLRHIAQPSVSLHLFPKISFYSRRSVVAETNIT